MVADALAPGYEVISSNDIDYVELVGPCLTRVMSMWRNDIKMWIHVYASSEKNSSYIVNVLCHIGIIKHNVSLTAPSHSPDQY